MEINMPRLSKLRERAGLAFAIELVNRCGRHQLTTHAAALAYYTVLSSIPVLFFVLSAGSLFIDTAEVQNLMLDALQSLLPTAEQAVRINVESVLQHRGTLSTVAALGALWSASGMFSVLETAVNTVWERPRTRSFWKRRLIGVLALLSVTAWVLLAFFTRTMWQLLPRWFPLLAALELPFGRWTERGLSFALVVILNLTVLRFFPVKAVNWRIATSVGLGVSVIWVFTRELFAWALTAGLLRYPFVYGSLWILIVPIVWAYWSYLLLLLGAELQAFLEEKHHHQLQEARAK